MTYEETLARKIYEIMKDELRSVNGGRRLRKVIVRCDTTEELDTAKLNSHWRDLASEPIYGGSHIEIHHDPPFGKCVLCNQEFELNEDSSRCPYCHHEQFRIIHEPPTIETYEIDPV